MSGHFTPTSERRGDEPATRPAESDHGERIRQISLMNVVAIIGAVCLLLLMEVPLQEPEALRSVYQVICYGFLRTSSLLGGLAVAIVPMLHRTILGLSRAVAPGNETGGFVRTGD